MRRAIKNLFSLLINERRCASCYAPFSPQKIDGKETSIRQRICVICLAALRPRTKGYCPTCGHIYHNENSPVASCVKCVEKTPYWENFRFFAPYVNEYKNLLIRAKFKGEAGALELLGMLISNYSLDLPTPDVIVPMPLHPSKLYLRGFNQCQEISRPIAKKLKRPIKNDLLFRVAPTKSQTNLSKEQRLKNIQKAFTASAEVEGLRILLIDDVMTTGTTLRQACKTLLANKAKAVDVCVAARTPDFFSKKTTD